jgi:hypothetical protein
MGRYKHEQKINDHMDDQILFNCCLSNDFKLQLGHNQKTVVIEKMRATGKEIAKHIIRLIELLPVAVLTLQIRNG